MGLCFAGWPAVVIVIIMLLRYFSFSKSILLFRVYFRQISTDFRNTFTDEFYKQYVTTRSFKIPPRLKRVVTLPCEIFIFSVFCVLGHYLAHADRARDRNCYD